ncbi:ABC transporter permease [Alloacidobacterium sp.]|uniref:ABC transporter permease n=1 Tax=Alloacidobacterium sp. TaxID=2951999 RepID=UPI002D30F36E|nr:ABC transporter permease [Alloacidobacterium sp.]HYK36391.1 ABC transporter permease [Alloacidobacterium sp.]
MLSDLLYRLRALFRRNTVEAELDDELRFHFEHEVEKYRKTGMNEDEARRRARMSFGGQEQVKEDCREARGTGLIESGLQDIRYALRQLRKTPGFTITAVLTLALGIGANCAIFTLVNAVLLKNLPVTDPKTLVRLGNNDDCCVGEGTNGDSGEYSLFSTDTYEQLKKNAPEFEELAAIQAGFTFRPVTVRRDGNGELARSVMGEFVSGNYFRTFGLKPQTGRLFTDADDVQGAPMVAVMSYEKWMNDYSGDPAIVGSTFYINTKPVTIAGIAPKGYFGDRLVSTPPDFYLPIETMPVLANVAYVHDPDQNWLYIVGRVKPGVQLGPLQAKLSGLLRQIFAPSEMFSGPHHDELLAKAHIVVTPAGGGIQWMQDDYSSHLHLLTWVAGLVLLIACANIANLLLVRGMARKAEMCVRTALGAARSRIIRQLLTESLVLAVLSGLVGLVVAYAGTRMLLMLAFPGDQNVPINASPSLEVLGFAFSLSLVTGVLFGVAPAWIAAQAEPADVLRSSSRSTVSGASLLQRGLVVGQAALSLVLLVGAGLFSQSLNKLESTNMRLETKNRYIVHFNAQTAGYAQTQVEALYRTMEDRFHAIPGVKRVGISSYTPMEDNNNGWGVQVEGKPRVDGTWASRIKANAEYFDSVGTRVVMGRGIGTQDTSATRPVAVVNQTFVRKLFAAGENPIGQHFGGGPESPAEWEIVGVVEDTAYTNVRWKDHLMYFVPLGQRPLGTKEPIEKDESMYVNAIVLDTDYPINNMETLARQTLAAINPNLTAQKFQTFDAQIADRFTEERLLARLTMLFGGLALLLATIGLYGVTSYTVVRRTSEIGIRMALGAERGSVIAMVMRGAVFQTLLGLAIGVPIALLCVRFVKAQLYEIASVDSSVLTVAILTLAVAACIAGLIPARRAASTDPVQALRTE